jgi:hypothetical protein
MANELYTWEISTKKERGAHWYILALAIVIGLVIWWFFTRQYWLSLIILLLSGLFYFVENNIADHVSVVVTPLWIKVGNSFYEFTSIKNYNFVYESENALLLRLRLQKKTLPIFDIDIDSNIASNLSPILSQYIEEMPKEEVSFSERFIKKIKL